MRRLSQTVLIVMMITAMGLTAAEAGAEKKIGVFMFSEETRYLEATQAFKKRLAEAGFDGQKVTYFTENAEGNKARAAEIVKKFAVQKPDMILSLGTSATVPLSREIRDIPIVFSVVYDPVDAGIASSWKSSGNNTTGSSPLVPMTNVIDILKKFAQVRSLAILYTPGEKNSEAQVRELQKIQDKYHFRILPVRLTKKEEVDQLLPEVLRSSDALYITGSNLVNSQIRFIVEEAAKAKVITITHLEDLVVKGVMLGVSADSTTLGRLSGDKAVKILKGAKPSALPIETAKKYTVLLNMNTARRGSFAIPEAFMKIVERKIE